MLRTMLGPQYPYPMTPNRMALDGFCWARYSNLFSPGWSPCLAIASAEPDLLLIGNSLLRGDLPQHARWVSGDDGVGRHVARHHAAGADDGVFSDDEVREDRRPGADRRSLLHQSAFDLPVVRGLKIAGRGRRA